ncbi:tandem-95 repeat protein [Saccharibacillus brassicae]|uniref:Tandem-95 repeat protein n=2 Tax=Saccharibacillus brassicae TaxID=2583377 RepID=A0A4Y6UWF7_SACBS|nr:tandem-95 repeat protein [Saccharibacillus brassicae]
MARPTPARKGIDRMDISPYKRSLASFTAVLMLLSVFFGYAPVTHAAVLPANGKQTFAGYTPATGTTLENQFFRATASPANALLIADSTGLFFDSADASISAPGRTYYYQIAVNGDLGSFILDTAEVGEYMGTDGNYTDIKIVGYSGGVEAFTVGPRALTIDGNATSVVPFDFAPAAGKKIDAFRVYYTLGDPSEAWNFNVFNFTISQATARNTAPVAAAGTLNVTEDNVQSGTLAGSDPESDPLTYSIVGQGTKGTAAITNVNTGAYTYTPNANATGADSFTFKVNDGVLDSPPATINVTIAAVNDAPTNLVLSSSSVAENAAIPTSVGTLTAVDPDAGDTFTYALASGSGDTDNASFTVSNGTLQTAASFDYETKASYSVRIGVTDSGGSSYEKVFALTVTNVNEAPTDLVLDDNNVAENEPLGTVVGTLSSIDPDAGDTFTRSLVSGSGDTDNDAFTISGSELRTNAVFDAEAKSAYAIRVRTTDSGGLSYEKAFTINVTDVNDAPVIGGAAANQAVNDNGSVTSFSGVTISDNDSANVTVTVAPDVAAKGSFTAASLTASGFAADGSGGYVRSGSPAQVTAAIRLLAFKPAENRVAPGQTETTTFAIGVNDGAGGLANNGLTTVVALSLNDAPTDMALSRQTVAEQQPSGTAVGTLSAVDPDTGETFAYSLVSGPGSADNGSFTIVGSELRTSAAFDYEAKALYSVRVRVVDNAGSAFEKTFEIGVTDVNDAPTNLTLSGTAVAENEPVGTVVGSLSAVDPDTGDDFVYTLASGSGDTDNAAFAIVGSELRTAAAFDFETKSSYSVRVRVTDRGGLTYEKAFAIQVSDTNDSPSILGTAADQPVNDNAAIAPFAAVEIVDPDSVSVTITVTADSAAKGRFTPASLSVGGFSESAGGVYTRSGTPAAVTSALRALSFVPAANRVALGQTETVTFDLVAEDSAGGRTQNQGATLKVSAVNDAPTDAALGSDIVAENAPIGTVVGKLSAVDADLGDTFAYTLAGGVGDTDNARFAIVGDELRTAEAFDYETKSAYSVRIQVKDAAGAMFEKSFAIRVTDANDAPTELALGSRDVEENRPAGTTVGTLTAVDPDAGDTFAYTLASGSGDGDNASFEIEGGTLRTAESFDFEKKTSYSVRIRVTDRGGLTYEQVFTINVLNANDGPAIAGTAANQPVTDKTTLNPFSNVTVSDIENDEVTAIVTVTDTAQGAFTAESLAAAGFEEAGTGTGRYVSDRAAPADVTAALRKLVFAPAENKAAPGLTGTVGLTLEVTDAEGASTRDEATTLVVASVNDAPTAIRLSAAEVRENLPVGTVVGRLSAADPDPADTFRYALVEGEGGADNAVFAAAGDELRTAERLDHSKRKAYSVRIRVTDANEESFEQVFAVTVTPQPAAGETPNPPTVQEPVIDSPPPAQSGTRQVDVVVQEGQEAAVRVEITRTSVGGLQLDTVRLNAAQATEAAAKAAAGGQDFARIVIDDIPGNPADEVAVNIPMAALSPLAAGDIRLEIQTGDVKLTLSSAALDALQSDGQDLYFRIVPIKQPEQRARLEQRVLNADEVRSAAAGTVVQVLGRPMTIETNYTGRPTSVELPLTDVTLPADPAALRALAARLAVYVEHSDGDTELQRGEVKYDARGIPVAIEIEVDKFSTFTIVAAGPSIQRERYVFGYTDGTFRPERTMTRAEIAAVISRNIGVPSGKGQGYTDVAASYWANAYIAHLQEAGIMTGDGSGKFRPGDAITRGELAALIAKWKALAPAQAGPAASDLAGHWARSNISAVMEAGFMTGYPDGTFKPNRALTRAEAVVALNKLFGRPPLEGVERPTWSDVPTSHWAYADIEAASGSYSAVPSGSGGEVKVDPR